MNMYCEDITYIIMSSNYFFNRGCRKCYYLSDQVVKYIESDFAPSTTYLY